MTVRLTVYDGAGVVGGNKVLLESGDSRLFFDFGTTFVERGRFFDGNLRPRLDRGLLDLLTLGLLPPLRDIYREDMLLGDLCVQRMQRWPGCRALGPLDGVFLSHAHLDHSGYISFLRGDVPVYCSGATAAVAKAWQDTGSGDCEHEICFQTRRRPWPGDPNLYVVDPAAPWAGRPFFTVDGPPSPALASFWSTSGQVGALASRPLVAAPPRIGQLPWRAFAVNHSLRGAMAGAVETEGGWVVYTGDLRLRGQADALTRQFAGAAWQLRPSLLICEGTLAQQSRATTEEDVFERALSTVRRTSGLVVADLSPGHLERLLVFREVAVRTRRRLAILSRDAYAWEALRAADRTVPDLAADPNIAIYRHRQGRGQRWEAGLVTRYAGKAVDARAVAAHQGEYLLCFSSHDLDELVDLDPVPGGVYIVSTSEVSAEEQRLDPSRLASWLREFGLTLVGLRLGAGEPTKEEGFHASAHITGPDLLELIRTIAPQAVLPVHTEDYGFFVDNLRGECRVLLPKRGQPFEL